MKLYVTVELNYELYSSSLGVCTLHKGIAQESLDDWIRINSSCGCDAKGYIAEVDITSEDLADFGKAAFLVNVSGFNVQIPFAIESTPMFNADDPSTYEVVITRVLGIDDESEFFAEVI